MATPTTEADRRAEVLAFIREGPARNAENRDAVLRAAARLQLFARLLRAGLWR